MSSNTPDAPEAAVPQTIPQPVDALPPPLARGANGAGHGPPSEAGSNYGFEVFVLVFGGFLFYCGAIMLSPPQSWWIPILFGLPVMAQMIGGGLHAKHHPKEHHYFYYFSMVLSNVCLFAYCFLWVCFANDLGGYKYLSWVSLVIVTFLILVILCMMSAFMKEPVNPESKLKKIRDGAAQDPFWAMTFLFFVIFLDVTYLFGFAFAFHDRYCLKETKSKAPALRMTNYDSSDDDDNGALVALGNVGHAEQPRGASPADGVDTDFYFFFGPGEAQLKPGELDYGKCQLPVPPAAPKPGEESRPPAPDEPHPPVPLAHLTPPQREVWLKDWLTQAVLHKDSNQLYNQLFNKCSLERLKLRIQEETKNGVQVRVTLVGQGDKNPIAESEKSHYKSNYELSEARVQNVRYEVIGALKNEDAGAWHNLEWLTLPSSNEPRTDAVREHFFTNLTCSKADRDVLEDMNDRVVAVSIMPVKGDALSAQVKRDAVRPMALIDYMYFSIYTITTTGYGDIIPTTSYAKFIISIANICEVLFLVVFFNALVSIRKDRTPGA